MIIIHILDEIELTENKINFLLTFLIPGFVDVILFQQKDNAMVPENIDLVFHVIATVTYSAWKKITQ